jgi:hypothetical protein
VIIRLPYAGQPVENVLRQIGYAPFVDPNTGEQSFVRRLGTYFYPRFHVYVETGNGELRVSLHLDQKKPSYPGFRKHSGEYGGPTVEAEADRIYAGLTQK